MICVLMCIAWKVLVYLEICFHYISFFFLAVLLIEDLPRCKKASKNSLIPMLITERITIVDATKKKLGMSFQGHFTSNWGRFSKSFRYSPVIYQKKGIELTKSLALFSGHNIDWRNRCFGHNIDRRNRCFGHNFVHL